MRRPPFLSFAPLTLIDRYKPLRVPPPPPLLANVNWHGSGKKPTPSLARSLAWDTAGGWIFVRPGRKSAWASQAAARSIGSPSASRSVVGRSPKGQNQSPRPRSKECHVDYKVTAQHWAERQTDGLRAPSQKVPRNAPKEGHSGWLARGFCAVGKGANTNRIFVV